MKTKASSCRLAAAAALPYLAFCLTHLVPLALTLIYAFMKDPVFPEFHLLDNFSYLLKNRYFLLGFRNLISLGLLMVLTAFSLSVLIAPLLCLHPRLAKLAIVLFILPMVIPSVSASVVWKNAFDTRSILESGKARFALISLFAWKYAGLGSTILFSALKRIPDSLTDAAKMDGAGCMLTYFAVRLPCIPGEIGAVIGLYLIFMLRSYKEMYLLFGAYPSEKVYMLQHYMNHQYTNMSFQYVAAGALLLILFALIMYTFTYFLFIKRRKAF